MNPMGWSERTPGGTTPGVMGPSPHATVHYDDRRGEWPPASWGRHPRLPLKSTTVSMRPYDWTLNKARFEAILTLPYISMSKT